MAGTRTFWKKRRVKECINVLHLSEQASERRKKEKEEQESGAPTPFRIMVVVCLTYSSTRAQKQALHNARNYVSWKAHSSGKNDVSSFRCSFTCIANVC